MRDLTAAAEAEGPDGRPLLVPRYADDPGPRNPLLLMRPAWAWVDELSGDRGLAPLVASRPDEVREVPVGGSMPDVDEAADLARVREQA